MMLERPASRIRRRWRHKNGLTVPTAEAMADALQRVPAGMPWAWAALRVLPTVRGERVQVMEDIELEELGFVPASSYPSVALPPGVDVTFSIEVDVLGLNVDQRQLDAWEMTADQVLPAAIANLRRTVGSWQGRAYDDVYEGVPVRMRGWPSWASSLLLLPDDLLRILGEEDQVLIAPYQCNLISLPVDVDRGVAADLVDLFGVINPASLLIGMPAFVLRDGRLSPEGLPGFESLEEAGIDTGGMPTERELYSEYEDRGVRAR